MDFLVAGLGFGALLVLAGYAVHEFGIFLFAPGRVRKQFPEKPTLSDAWRRICRFGSIVAMSAGVAIWLVLAVAVVFAVSDKTGAYLLATVATAASIAGAGAIYLVYRRLFSPAALLRNFDVTAVSSGWNEPEVVANDDTEPVGVWRPRIIPAPSETFVEDMPAWGAVYAAPVAAEPEPETPAPIAEPIRAEQPEPAEVPGAVAEAESDAPAPAAAAIETAEEAEAAPVAPAIAAEASEPDESEPEPDVDAAEVAEAEVADTPVEIDATQFAPAAVAMSEPEPVDQIISETPAPVADVVVPPAPRRFKSALLSDLDEPAAVDANTKYQSTILADLSAVRLPDDGPRYRSTALVDVAKPDGDEPESESENGAPPRHD